MYRTRSVEPQILQDLREKFVFISGPRQVGKTELAKRILSLQPGKYYNWDLIEDREAILKKQFVHDSLAVLDEVHKYERWKTFVKGIFDKYHEELKIIVTGSARLDIYRRGGDSLFGRYHLHYLHPFSVGELSGTEILPPKIIFEPLERGVLYDSLFEFGGFPEPLFKNSKEAHRRWSITRRERLIEEDVRSLTSIKLLGLLEHLMLLLPTKVGAPLSMNSLSRDLEVGFNTVKGWIENFERLFIAFRVSPFTQKITRSLKKEKKLYLWDWSQVESESARFENMVASHLWKAVTCWRSQGYGDFELRYLRDRDRREVDFCVIKDRRPWLLVEAKASDEQPSEPLYYFSNKLATPAVQVLHKKNVFRRNGPVTTISADVWLPQLP
ncbi:MAG TPA: AAA family ATPase [Bdellovibrionota bacterium]|nr:AAA family ATPase [Bdellovibrionota bacterium]